MFLGMRGTGDWVDDQRPKNWREQILYLYPNGTAPLTALMSKMSSQKVDDPQFHWWTYVFSSVQGPVAQIHTVPGQGGAYAPGAFAVTGDVLYFTIAEAQAVRMTAGHQVLLRASTDPTLDTVGKVLSVTLNGALSEMAVRLLEDDDNSTAGNDLSDCDMFRVIGNINAEGAEMPDPIALNPEKHHNLTQIFRTSLSMTRTAMNTRLRTGNDYQKAKREALEMHSVEMELAYLWGIRTENVGSNGKPERTTWGLINSIRELNPNGVDDYLTNPAYGGAAVPFLTGGEHWLDERLEMLFRYGAGEKLCFAGSGALLALNRIIKNRGTFEFVPTTKAYGIRVVEWHTPFGMINIVIHPLFSFDVVTRHMMVIFEPKDLKYRFITDTTFYGEGKDKTHPEGYGQRRIDGLMEEFLTEAGMEFHFPVKAGVLYNVNAAV